MKHAINVKFVVTVEELCRKIIQEHLKVLSPSPPQPSLRRSPSGSAAGAMDRAWLVALWCATATMATAARYSDYSGARMPQYDGAEYEAREAEPAPAPEPDDYRGPAPDLPPAPAAPPHAPALDYKLEEELAGALAGKAEQPSDKKEVEETDSWQRPARRQRKKKTSRAVERTPEVDRFDPDEDFPKAKTSNRFFTKHRPRLKSRRYGSSDETHRYPPSRNRHDDSDLQENEEHGDKYDYRSSKRNSMEEKSRYGRGDRVARRKPRDKDRPVDMDIPRLSDRSDTARESDIEQWMAGHGGMGRPPGPDALSDLERSAARRRPDSPIRGAKDEDYPQPTAATRDKGNSLKEYDEYGDYNDDMKRVMNIKSRLPGLLRRPTAATAGEEAASPRGAPPPAPALPGPSRSLQQLLANRRVFLPPAPATRTTLRTTVAPDITGAMAHSDTTTQSTTTTVATAEPFGPALRKIKTDLVPKANASAANNGTEMSLAEKSRLSILKKAQRKESMEGGPSTKKPPVLLQVTKKLPTVVMVEPPTSEAFFRAREVFQDSPARLNEVKRLMRHKLVANAKNIHDLTDNWDDVVCDYVDMSLVEHVSGAAPLRPAALLLLPLVLLIR